MRRKQRFIIPTEFLDWDTKPRKRFRSSKSKNGATTSVFILIMHGYHKVSGRLAKIRLVAEVVFTDNKGDTTTQTKTWVLTIKGTNLESISTELQDWLIKDCTYQAKLVHILVANTKDHIKGIRP